MPTDAAVFVRTHTHKAQDSGHEALHFEACEDVFPSEALHFDTEMHASISHAHMLGPCAGDFCFEVQGHSLCKKPVLLLLYLGTSHCR